MTQTKLPKDFEDFLRFGHMELFDYQRPVVRMLFRAWETRTDAAIKQARQTGKTAILSVWLAYMIIRHRIRLVIISTKQQKTQKISRKILQIMRASGQEIDPNGVMEGRFEDDAGFICLSGNKEAQRESESADIVLVDEAQDVDYANVYPDLGPMTNMTNGIVMCIGIGGIASSFIETMFDDPQVLTAEVPRGVVESEARRTGNATLIKWVERMKLERQRLTPVDFAAHYECMRIPDVEYALLPNIHRWDDKYPGRQFSPLEARDLRVGIDWGKRSDSSALVGVAVMHTEGGLDYVLYGYGQYSGLGYAQQIERINEKLESDDFPWTTVYAETVGVGNVCADILKDKLVRPEALKEAWPGQSEKSECCKTLQVQSQANRMLWVDDGEFAQSCINDLKNVGVRYTASDLLKPTHSDWLAALMAPFYPVKIAEVK